MEQYLPFALSAGMYLGGIALTIFLFRMSWDMSQGKGFKNLVINFAGFLVIFACMITIMPSVFRWGFGKVYGELRTSPEIADITKIAQAGYALASSSTTTSGSAPEIDLTSMTNSSAANSAPESSAPAAAPAGNSNAATTWKGPLAPSYYDNSAPESAAPAAQPAAAPASNAPVIEWKGPLAPSYYDGTQPTPAFTGPWSPEHYNAAPAAQPTTEWKGPLAPDAYNNGGGPQSYTVQHGDSLGKIAKQFNVSVNTLCQANAGVIRNCNIIRAGWVLAIP